MKFYQLGFRYLQRKKGKTILLLIVLILVNSMILGTSMILRTTNESKQAMQEKTNSKIVAEITSKDSKITENEVNKIETLEDVSSINRIGRQVCGEKVSIEDEQLARALKAIEERKRNIVLQYFFIGDTDTYIGKMLDCSRANVTKCRIQALDKLKQLIEEEKEKCQKS